MTKYPLLVIDSLDESVLPRNFRLSTSNDHLSVSKIGLNELKASASGQFTKKSLELAKMSIPSQEILIIDLRQESHGFINDMAISWYGKDKNWENLNKSLEFILSDEINRLNNTAKEKTALIHFKKNKAPPLNVEINRIYTEKELVESLNLNYKRLPITDHVKPNSSQVDQFVKLISSEFIKPEKKWVHFHCAAGRGRSTTFIAIYDMMLNSSKVSFDDIIVRQAEIGGKDLAESFDSRDWRYQHGLERLDFLKQFYKYCLDNPSFQKSWSEWESSLKI
jgi:protein tyrosine phosphatase